MEPSGDKTNGEKNPEKPGKNTCPVKNILVKEEILKRDEAQAQIEEAVATNTTISRYCERSSSSSSKEDLLLKNPHKHKKVDQGSTSAEDRFLTRGTPDKKLKASGDETNGAKKTEKPGKNTCPIKGKTELYEEIQRTVDSDEKTKISELKAANKKDATSAEDRFLTRGTSNGTMEASGDETNGAKKMEKPGKNTCPIKEEKELYEEIQKTVDTDEKTKILEMKAANKKITTACEVNSLTSEMISSKSVSSVAMQSGPKKTKKNRKYIRPIKRTKSKTHDASGETETNIQQKEIGSLSSKKKTSCLERTVTQKAYGKKKQTPPQKEIAQSEVSAAPEEERCFMGETKINRANGGPENKNTQSKVPEPVKEPVSIMKMNSRRGLEMGKPENDNLHSEASTSSKMETCVLEETKLQEASGGKKIHGSCGGKKKPQNENKLRKVSAAPEEERCFMGETKINRANGGPENKNTQSKVPQSVKEPVSIMKTKSRRGLEMGKPENDNLHSEASTTSKMETCVLEETKSQEASGGKKIHWSGGVKKKPQNENKLRKVSAAPEEERCFMGETKINGANGGPENKNTQSKVPEPVKEPVSIMKTKSRRELEMGKPENDNLHSEAEILELRKKVAQQASVIMRLHEDKRRLDDWNKKFLLQIGKQLEDLRESQAMDVRGTNFIYATLENLQGQGQSHQTNEIINMYEELVAILYERIDILTRRPNVPVIPEL